MGRYTGPRARINRRLGVMVFENSGAMKSSEKKSYPPGMHTRRKKPSTYGTALTEKQKIKFYYGLRDKHLRRYFEKAKRTKGNTGEQMLILCERRLDNVIRRAGFSLTRNQARQGVAHRHFQVNGRTVSSPSFMVRSGDKITVRNRANLKNLYKELSESSTTEATNWISCDTSSLEIIVNSILEFDDVSLPVDVGQVVAFMSR